MSNSESFVTPKAVRLVQTLGNIENPFDQVKLSVENLGDNSTLIDLKNLEATGKEITRHVNQATNKPRRENKVS